MSSPLGIVASPPEKHNLCSACSGLHLSGHGCLVRHCPSCNGLLKFTTRICLKCSTDKSVCQVCETPLPKPTRATGTATKSDAPCCGAPTPDEPKS